METFPQPPINYEELRRVMPTRANLVDPGPGMGAIHNVAAFLQGGEEEKSPEPDGESEE